MHHAIKILAAAVICAGIVGCGPSDDRGKHDQTYQNDADQSQGGRTRAENPPPPSPEELAQSQRPEKQVTLDALLKRVDDAQQAQLDAANQIIADRIFNEAYQAYCSKMQNDGTLKNWTAMITNIYDGKPPGIALETSGGLKIFQEIDSSSPFYQTLLSLKEGDYVKFSMTISHALKDAPSMTYQECATDPDGTPHINRYLSGDLTALAPLH